MSRASTTRATGVSCPRADVREFGRIIGLENRGDWLSRPTRRLAVAAPVIVGLAPVIVGLAPVIVGLAPVIVGLAPVIVGLAPVIVGLAGNAALSSWSF